MVNTNNNLNNDNSNLISIKLEKPDLTDCGQYFACTKLNEESLVTKDYLYSTYIDKKLIGFLDKDIYTFCNYPFEFFKENKIVEYTQNSISEYRKTKEFNKLKLNAINMFLEHKELSEYFIKWNTIKKIYLNINDDGNYLYAYYQEDDDFLKTTPEGFLKAFETYYPIKVFVYKDYSNRGYEFKNEWGAYTNLEYVIKHRNSFKETEEFSKEEYIRKQNIFFDSLFESQITQYLTASYAVILIFVFEFHDRLCIKPIMNTTLGEYCFSYMSNFYKKKILAYKEIVYQYLSNKENLELRLKNLIDKELVKKLDS